MIGERIESGELVARIGAMPLLAPLRGVLRDLMCDGISVALRTKVIEVDPGGDADDVRGIGECPRRIAEGVLAAMQHKRAGVRSRG